MNTIVELFVEGALILPYSLHFVLYLAIYYTPELFFLFQLLTLSPLSFILLDLFML